jgi:hypothetical protein
MSLSWLQIASRSCCVSNIRMVNGAAVLFSGSPMRYWPCLADEASSQMVGEEKFCGARGS